MVSGKTIEYSVNVSQASINLDVSDLPIGSLLYSYGGMIITNNERWEIACSGSEPGGFQSIDGSRVGPAGDGKPGDIYSIDRLPGINIDDLDIAVDDFAFKPEYLSGAAERGEPVSETLSSNLLKSNCLVTNQPDWGSVVIRYEGRKIDRESLLRYLISFRQHNEFHEQCVERIFNDIKQSCRPEKLSVFARYTRRGGLDINPFRSDFETAPALGRLIRQ